MDGEAAGNNDAISLNMSDPHSLLAKFSKPYVVVTVTSDPTGEGFMLVDGEPLTTPAELHWTIGKTHTLSTLTPVSGGSGVQYLWVNWSDSGEQTHEVAVSQNQTTFTASYKKQYLLNFLSVEGYGSTTPASPGDYWFDVDVTVEVRATPKEGYFLNQWRLDEVSVGSENPISVTMDRTHSLKAVFEYGAETLIVEAVQEGGGVIRGLSVTVDGSMIRQTDSNGRVNFTVTKGTHTVLFQSPYSKDVGTRYLFLRWEDGVTENPRTVASFGSPLRGL